MIEETPTSNPEDPPTQKDRQQSRLEQLEAAVNEQAQQSGVRTDHGEEHTLL